jgi:hypothetical protein
LAPRGQQQGDPGHDKLHDESAQELKLKVARSIGCGCCSTSTCHASVCFRATAEKTQLNQVLRQRLLQECLPPRLPDGRSESSFTLLDAFAND